MMAPLQQVTSQIKIKEGQGMNMHDIITSQQEMVDQAWELANGDMDAYNCMAVAINEWVDLMLRSLHEDQEEQGHA
jgi:hypothetical protein